ncbi:alanine racemase [Chryseobacterium potabilaquae]|uniref:D-threonine aldolase n=1 Tax=Chryseobacterium potabilaquae TaxID=2675057 RepID=A0A6N4XAB8_9FLAO|nr:alanine racemase [Chryseobacterium potabilaquae]CAA7196350.1 D-threonine aldolase [Chryseobacterium potabilaquae]
MIIKEIHNLSILDSPSIILIREIMEENINLALNMVPLERFRPHVKTNKILEICEILKSKGVNKFKASTISELEMLGIAGAPDVLLAHQPTFVKMERFLKMIHSYPGTKFSCIFDNYENLNYFNELLKSFKITQDIYIDINVGMNRTGVSPSHLITLFEEALKLDNINIIGFHIYDGHIRETDIDERNRIVNEAFQQAYSKIETLEKKYNKKFIIIAGGSPSFSVHAQNPRVECSPGTFIFWDWKYSKILPDLNFKCAVYVISRVISIINSKKICLDVGHKAIASENPFPRIIFLDFPEAKSISQSEEHLVLEIEDTSNVKVGDIFIGIPDHICPTIALHEYLHVVEKGEYLYDWKVMAKNRKINI